MSICQSWPGLCPKTMGMGSFYTLVIIFKPKSRSGRFSVNLLYRGGVSFKKNWNSSIFGGNQSPVQLFCSLQQLCVSSENIFWNIISFSTHQGCMFSSVRAAHYQIRPSVKWATLWPVWSPNHSVQNVMCSHRRVSSFAVLILKASCRISVVS